MLLKLSPEISSEIVEKNRLRREWQWFHEIATKRKINNKIAFVRSILKMHKQVEWH